MPNTESSSSGLVVQAVARALGAIVLRIIGVLAAISIITFVYSRIIPVNATTVALTYLIAILSIAAFWGLAESVAASIAAVLCFNYFFLPPVGTFTIADPQNWIALLAFLITSIVASQLSARAKQRAQLAVDRQLEMERLYALSRGILLAEGTRAAPKQIVLQIAQIFGFPVVVLYERTTNEIHRAGPEDIIAIEEKLREAALQGTLFHDQSSRTLVAAIRLGGEPFGSLAIRGASLSDTALQALSNLVAIGLEKVRTQEAASRAEVARQSEELKSTLLDAIAHEFKTPLTSIKAAASGLLLTSERMAHEDRELVTVIDEEADHLGRLVNEAIHTARVEAGMLELHKEMHRPSELINVAVAMVKSAHEERVFTVDVAEDLPTVLVDGELVELALRQLLDNAVKYSSRESAIIIRARKCDSNLVISVIDQGPGIPEEDQERIFERFYRGRHAHRGTVGTGMGLAIARDITHAHGGDIWFKSSPGEGTEFSISMPLAKEERAA